jgi:hypothetical protein
MTPLETLLSLLSVWDGKILESPPGSNAGERVEAIQRWCGGAKSDSWCAEFVYFAATMTAAAHGKPYTLPRTGSCESLRVYSGIHKLTHRDPAIGDIYLLLDSKGRAHHTGFVTSTAISTATFTETSGNTSNPTQAASREGYGVFSHTRLVDSAHYVFINWLATL